MCPPWSSIKISTQGKYLGFIIGPIALGFIAERSGMAAALNINVVLLVGIGIVLAFVGKETVGRKGRGKKGDTSSA